MISRCRQKTEAQDSWAPTLALTPAVSAGEREKRCPVLRRSVPPVFHGIRSPEAQFPDGVRRRRNAWLGPVAGSVTVTFEPPPNEFVRGSQYRRSSEDSMV